MHFPTHHLFLVAFFLLLSLCHASPFQGDGETQLLRRTDDDGISARDGAGLVKRQCIRNGCKCARVSDPGVYCESCLFGNNFAVLKVGDTSVFSGDVSNWAFECNKEGGCCAYGPSGKCTGDATGTCGAD